MHIYIYREREREPGGLQSMGSLRVGHDRSKLAHMHRYIYMAMVASKNKTIYSEATLQYGIRT